MADRCLWTLPGLSLVALVCAATTAVACAGGGAGGPASPVGPAADAAQTGTTAPGWASPSPTLSAADLEAAQRVVRRLIAAVDGDRYTLARSLMVDPDHWWGLDDMKSIRSIRLERIAVFRVAAPDAVMVETDLVRHPPPMAGGPDWPNFMLVVRDASGTWRVAQTATGP